MTPFDEKMPYTRRVFLRQAAAMGALPGIASILASCGGGGGAAATEAVARSKGGTLRVSQGADIRGFDVQRFYDLQSVTLGDALFSRLVTHDPQDARKIIPDLAVEVPRPENGGTTYTFRLRPDARFHDGSPVTAADVKFSIERLINVKTKSDGGSYYTGIIKDTEGLAAGKQLESSGITAVDDKTVRFELVKSHTAFLDLMAIWFASVYPKAVVEQKGEKFNQEPVGSGPFKFDSYKPGQAIAMSRFPNYFDARAIFLDGINLEVAVQASTAILRIDGGELDLMVDDVPSAAYNSIRNDPKRNRQLVDGLTDNVLYLQLNDIVHSLFKSLDVRRACAMAIDKQAFVQHDQGRGQVATGFWSPKSQYYDPDFPAIPYDPAAAKSLIQSAGVAGQKVDIIAPSPGSSFPLDGWAPLVAQNLEEIGLKTNIISLEFSAWLGRTMDSGAVVPDGWPMDVPHGSFVVDSAFTTATKEAALKDNTCCNFSRWSSPEADKLDEIGNTTVNKPEEIQAYQKIMRIAMSQLALWVPVYWPKRVLYHGPKLQGLSVPSNTAALLLSRLSLSA